MLIELAQSFSSGFHNQNLVHPVGLTAVILLGIATIMVPRRWAFLPMLILACMIPSAQRVVVGGLDFSFLRIMVLFGWTRVLLRQELTGFKLTAQDYVLIAWAASSTLFFTMQRGTGDALIYQLGTSYDAIGMYFFFRWVIKDWSDLKRVGLSLAVVAVPVALFFAVERATGRNIFAVFGGVKEVTAIRQGRLRCQGAFSHPILAGCFFATTIPYIAALFWLKGTARYWAIIGSMSAVLVIFFCASSTPVAALLFVMIGACLFFVRQFMREIRWAAVIMLILLHLFMNAPVWSLVGRIDLSKGGTGWHRYRLIDAAINRFGEWAVMGTQSTAHWGRGLTDVTNQYVLEGVRGGFVTLALFVATLVLAFRNVGIVLKSSESSRAKQVMAWSMGVALFAHATSFIAVSYFGQIIMLWYLSLALPASMVAQADRERRERTRRRLSRKRRGAARLIPDTPVADEVDSVSRGRANGLVESSDDP